MRVDCATRATRRFVVLFLLMLMSSGAAFAQDAPTPFGSEYSQLDSLAVGEWWTKEPKGRNPPPSMDVPRDEVLAFALYTYADKTLKLTAQLFPLRPGEAREVRLELKEGPKWVEVASARVLYPGWSAHFRIDDWDASRDVPYRVRHGDAAVFEGRIRRDPVDQRVIVVANMSCNSSRTVGQRAEIVDSLLRHDPDLLFFAGDQTYRHTEHTAGWIEFGLQFRDVIRDRPTITIPDDHDVGHPNLWGEGGRKSRHKNGADGGYIYPPAYVNMVQRQQTWHLPDPVDPTPVRRGISVYYTRLRLGEIDFAILEDRKFKTGPLGAIPQLGPRPDHINDPDYDPQSIDLPNLVLLGERQLKFLDAWAEDWAGVRMKAVLSQTAFCGAVHLHGKPENRLLADLDCNGWPQSGRQRALEAIRRAWAVHLCGDQHLAVVVKHGIDAWDDGPYAFTSPALVNTIYGRWWHPLDEKPGRNPLETSELPWTGGYLDGLGNKITMLAYANPGDIRDERQRGDGYGVVRFDKQTREITFECWPRFPDSGSEAKQFAGWPITVPMRDNDGRQARGWLPVLQFEGIEEPVVQVINSSTSEKLYTVRIPGTTFQPVVYDPGRYQVKVGHDSPEAIAWEAEAASTPEAAGTHQVEL